MGTRLLKKIETKQAVIGVVGLGYVGLPLLLCFVEKGFRSNGLDIDAKKTTCSRYPIRKLLDKFPWSHFSNLAGA